MRLDTMALMRLTLTLFNPSEPTSSSPHTPITALHGLQGGYVRCSEPMDIIRVDLKPKMKKIDLDGALSVLVSAVACVLLVVAIYDMDEEGEEEENDGGGMDEEEEENDDDDDDMEEE